ncbi:hypothetical protein I203_104107 [Kwoniella mangroviensis CBS 8507]|uniref:uncharacterized protein n=1 Tax=Kwoniella mangroviensis CBS 8507 TaxID=1296122 RepID=UPI00080D081E|nr:uncharacterized protein I203_06413 [Kwoniella mangroviensis CBS 8507]OCF64678.1 hypothetical protein I203_06413 [Kwoniella mangroviensis CBS 8507]
MPPKVEKESWNDDHTAILLRGIIRQSLIHRSDIYQLPGLEGVSENGGDRINKKLQSILKKLSEKYPGMVDEELKSLGRSRTKNGNSNGITTPTSSPKKDKGGNGNTTPKKRKVKEEEEDE